MRVLVFGDSIVYGAWDSQGGWVDRVKDQMHKQTIESQGKNKVQVINLGIGGDSSTKILARMEAEIKARYSKSWPFVFVITYGANDERTTDGVVETDLATFEANTREIIEIAKKYTDKIVFIGALPVGAEVVELKGAEYSNDQIIRYDKKLQEVVKNQGITFVSLRELFNGRESEVYSYDLIHPNDMGHELVAKAVIPHLQNMIIK